MQTIRWIGFPFGLVGIVVTWWSVLTTLVIPRGGGSVISRTLGRSVRACFRFVTRRTSRYQRVDSILAVQGPIFILLLLMAWLTIFVASYTLVVWPLAQLTLFGTFREVSSSFFTLGFAVPTQGTSLVVNVLAAATGPLIVALQIAYLPTLYSAFARREALVTLLDARAGSPPWGPELLMRHNLVTSLDRLPDLYEQWENWAADVDESHTNYRTLFYFRSPDPWRSWVTALMAVLDSAAMYLALCPLRAPTEARMVLRMGFTCFQQLAQTMRLPLEVDPDPDTTNLQLTYQEFADAVALLREAGFPLERSAEEAWPHFKGWRVNYELAAYSVADLVTASPAPWSGPRSQLRNVPIAYPIRPEHKAPGGERFTDRVPPLNI